jgi:hypothetical protein
MAQKPVANSPTHDREWLKGTHFQLGGKSHDMNSMYQTQFIAPPEEDSDNEE